MKEVLRCSVSLKIGSQRSAIVVPSLYVIPATPEAKVGGWKFEVSLDKMSKSLSQQEVNQRAGWVCGSSGRVII
jgi:hypothetical protein